MTWASQLDPSDHTSRADASARLARLYQKHGRMVYGICRAMLRDSHDAEDAAQQTFLLAHRALLGGAHVRNDAAWLATIARNESRTRIAASMRSPLPVSEEDLAAIPTTGDEAERAAQLEAIRSALAGLPERQREAVVLRHLYGLTYGEVAAALGLSRPATEALLFRARRSMRVRLRHAVTTAIAVPLAVQEGLAQAIPGFGAAGPGGVVAAAAGGGVLTKLASGPVAAKVAAATVAVTTAGTVGTIESERSGRDRAERDAVSTGVGTRANDDGSGRRGTSGSSKDEGDEIGTSGRGGGGEGRGDNSDQGSSSSGHSADDRDLDDSSGSGTSGGGDGHSGPNGSGSDQGGGGESPSEQGGSSGSGSSGSGSSGSGSSGSGSSGSDSSGSGSGEDTAHLPDSSDSSGSGSSSAAEPSSSGSVSSGSGSSGSGSSGSESSGSGSSGSGSSGSGSSGSGSGGSGGGDDEADDDEH